MRTQYVHPGVVGIGGESIVTTHNRNGRCLVDHYVSADNTRQGIEATLHEPSYSIVRKFELQIRGRGLEYQQKRQEALTAASLMVH